MKPVGYSPGLLLVTASAIAWSTAGLFTRLIPLDSWTMLAWRGIFGALGLAFFTLGARLLPAIETALIGSLDAPLAPLWVWLVFSETPGGSTIIGGAIVFVDVAAHLLRASRNPVSLSNES